MKHYPTKNTQGKLSYADVREIRRTPRTKYRILAQKYGVSISAIKDVVKHYTYRYVQDLKEGE